MQVDSEEARSGSLSLLAVAFAVAFAVMLVLPIWRWKGAFSAAGHEGHGGAATVSAEAFQARIDAQAAQYGIGDGEVAPPPGSTVYIQARQFTFTPSRIRLRRGEHYTLSFYAVDVMHGVSLIQDGSLSGILIPGTPTDMAIQVDKAGEVQVRCSEYCGAGHHIMMATLVVDGPGLGD